MVYLIGSLRNPEVPNIAKKLRDEGFEVFDDWYAAGPEADDKWRDYEKGRGRSYTEALQGLAADHVFGFDYDHLNRANAGILVLPAGKSAHLELGFLIGKDKKGYILLDNDPDRFDVMYKFATLVTDDLDKIIKDMKDHEEDLKRQKEGMETIKKRFTPPEELLDREPYRNYDLPVPGMSMKDYIEALGIKVKHGKVGQEVPGPSEPSSKLE